MGLNSAGVQAVAARLEAWRHARVRSAPAAGANIAKNKDTPAAAAAADYARCAARLGPAVDFLVINVSSPNTPGIRALQAGTELVPIVRAVRGALATLAVPPPLLLKVAPDLDAEQRAEIARVSIVEGLNGLVVGNTTTQRPISLRSRARDEPGGLSGAPLAALALASLRAFRELTGGRLPLVAVGGIGSGAEAYARIRAGASAVQLYTALVYEGPGLIRRMKLELAALLRRDGFPNVGQAVGTETQRASVGRA
jgi:dihydroorotate dehydrogenase